ncbi:MAG: D-cysteine desulfhydrase family protein [Lacipirellulaceae bacterium]
MPPALPFNNLPRVPLANLPTPLEPLANLSRKLNIELWIKRDDLTGLATGGNKTRKLEFLIAAALEQGADTVITAGGPQSNHCRQTAAAAAKFNLACHLVLGGEPEPPLGNLLLDRLLGAEVHWVAKPERNARMEQLAGELRAAGRKPYVIPVGGSNAVGAVGYAVAVAELVEQARAASVEFDRIVFPTSSGGTQAGMLLGAQLAGLNSRVTAVSIDVQPDDRAYLEEVAGIANEAASLMGTEAKLTADDLDLAYDYLGEGYGVVGDLERRAIRTMAQAEGFILGPVYSGRGFGGLLDMVAKGDIKPGSKVLYWHTGDESALHAYADAVVG